MIPDRVLRGLLRSDHRVALFGDLVRAAIALALVGVLAVAFAYYALMVKVMFTVLHMNDFGKFYYSARAFLDGGDMYGPNPATAVPVSATETRQLWNMNPPHFHVLVLPLARLSPLPAYVIWSIESLIALVLSVAVITRELRLRWSASRLLWALTGFVVCSATLAVIVTGQLSFILLLPVTLAWRAARHGQWPRAGAWLGLVGSVKPFFGIFGLYFLLTKRFRAAEAMAITGVACVLVGLAVFGWQSYHAWITALRGVTWPWLPMNGSIAALLARTFAESPSFSPSTLAPGLVSTATALATAGVVVVTALAVRNDHSAEAADRAFALLLLTAQLIGPLGWVYYLWFLAGPIAALWPGFRQRPSAARGRLIWLAVPGLLCPMELTVRWGQHSWAAPTIGSIYTWTTLFMWAALVLDRWASRSFDRS